MSLKSLPSTIGRRLYSTGLSVEALDKWISARKQLVLSDTLSVNHLKDLYITLPTRDGTKKTYEEPKKGAPLGYGHHLAFFHPRNPEPVLRTDGTDADFCPPEPFTRRMWAGGKLEWKSPLIVGENATAVSNVVSVEKKGFEKGSPMVFVKQRIDVTMENHDQPSVVEERSHVYLPVVPGVASTRVAREVPGLPLPDFSFKYKPTLTTLFRFSALTFNGHHIHLDKDYAQKAEGYPERLVHGPLSALMLIEATVFHKPDAQLKSFEYRARNPTIVNRSSTIYGVWENATTAQLWTVDDEGVVGMTGKVCL